MIKIEEKKENVYEVTVEGPTTTVHEVTIPEGYWEKLTGEKITREDLIQKTFEFMLERENNDMIMRRLDLLTVARNFPEYEMVIKRRIKE